jgi:hypothetical protein
VDEGACVRKSSFQLPSDYKPYGPYVRVFCKEKEEPSLGRSEIVIYGYDDFNCRDRSARDPSPITIFTTSCYAKTATSYPYSFWWDKCQPTIPFEGSIPPMSGSAVVAASPPLMDLCLLLFATTLFLGVRVGQRG